MPTAQGGCSGREEWREFDMGLRNALVFPMASCSLHFSQDDVWCAQVSCKVTISCTAMPVHRAILQVARLHIEF